MKQHKTDIEEIFQKGFDDHTVNPSENVLRQIRFKLWLRDFLSFNPRKLNILYLFISLGIIGTSIKVTSSYQGAQIKKLSAKKPLENTDENRISEKQVNYKPDTTALTLDKSKASLPDVSFSPSESKGCVPLKVVFHSKSTNGKKYLWNFGNGKTSNEKNPKTIFTQPGNYMVSLTVTNEAGLQNSTKSSILVHEKPVALADINMEESEIKSRKIVFRNKSKNADSYFWNFGDNSTSKQENTVHTYNVFGHYKVVMIAYSQFGCADTITFVNNFIDKDYELTFPTKFHPGINSAQSTGYYENSGDQNLIFYPLNNGAQEYLLKIFAPNGIEVFSTTNIKQGWNGYIKGRLAPPGKYYFVATGIYPNGKAFEIKNYFDVIIEEVNGYY